MSIRISERLHTAMLIREAINTYPDGICFASAGGRPILANRKINDVCYSLTGHTIVNAEHMWGELTNLKMTEMPSGMHDEKSGDTEQILCRLPNGQVWQFQRRKLIIDSSPVIQYEASDVSDLYKYRTRLFENNRRAEELHKRQRILLQNIVQNNMEKELLSAKIRIHDDFGRLLVMTRNRIENGKAGEDDAELFRAWEDVIADMENASRREVAISASPENELLKIAEMIECHIDIVGDKPKERKTVLLFNAAIREALTNAVRHAHANRLNVETRYRENCFFVRISCNGQTDVTTVHERGGLSDLRRRLEQEGAELTMKIEDGVGVVMYVTIPGGKNEG